MLYINYRAHSRCPKTKLLLLSSPPCLPLHPWSPASGDICLITHLYVRSNPPIPVAEPLFSTLSQCNIGLYLGVWICYDVVVIKRPTLCPQSGPAISQGLWESMGFSVLIRGKRTGKMLRGWPGLSEAYLTSLHISLSKLSVMAPLNRDGGQEMQSVFVCRGKGNGDGKHTTFSLPHSLQYSLTVDRSSF